MGPSLLIRQPGSAKLHMFFGMTGPGTGGESSVGRIQGGSRGSLGGIICMGESGVNVEMGNQWLPESHSPCQAKGRWQISPWYGLWASVCVNVCVNMSHIFSYTLRITQSITKSNYRCLNTVEVEDIFFPLITFSVFEWIRLSCWYLAHLETQWSHSQNTGKTPFPIWWQYHQKCALFFVFSKLFLGSFPKRTFGDSKKTHGN